MTPSVLQVGNLLDQPGEGARLGHARGRMAGEAADVQLVDDAVFERRQGRRVLLPVERAAEEEAAADRCCGVSPVSHWLPHDRRRRIRRWRRGRAGRWWGRSGGRGRAGPSTRQP